MSYGWKGTSREGAERGIALAQRSSAFGTTDSCFVTLTLSSPCDMIVGLEGGALSDSWCVMSFVCFST